MGIMGIMGHRNNCMAILRPHGYGQTRGYGSQLYPMPPRSTHPTVLRCRYFRNKLLLFAFPTTNLIKCVIFLAYPSLN
jgi:hypothetical protein